MTHKSTDADKQLDRLLGDWSNSRADSLASGDNMASGDELRERIVSQLADGSPVAEPAITSSADYEMPRSSTWLFAGMAAVVLLVAMLALREPADEPPVAHSDTPSDSLAAFVPAAANAAEKALLLDELEQLFGGEVCWVAETGGDVDLGMCSGSTAIETEHAPVSVRWTVVRRSAGEQQWSQVWSMDVTTRSQHVVRTGPSDTNVAMWVYHMPDGMLAVDSDLTFDGPFQLQSSYSGVQQSGVPSEIHTATIDGSDYAVFQTVVSLNQQDDVS